MPEDVAGRRIGIGHDIHRLVAGRDLVLGGVTIGAEQGFDTPSDGDVLCHALIDALAGALVDGDLGRFFPADEDPAALGARSLDYLGGMGEELSRRGFAVEHLDAYISLGTTRLAPHLDAMRANVAGALSAPVERVSVKARTNDGLGPDGEGRAASATVVVSLRESRPVAASEGAAGGAAARTTIAPELAVRRGRAAITFYAAAFGAVEDYRVGGTDDQPEVVAQLSVGGATFWVADESPEHGSSSPETLGGASARILLVVGDPDAVVARAVAAGATEMQPVEDAHGWRLGRIADPFGHHWEIGRPLGAWPPR